MMHVLLAFVATAFAGAEAGTRLDHYVDDWIDVWLPAVRAAWSDRDTRIEASYLADVLSGATYVLSSDAVSGATSFDETRHQLGLSWTGGPWRLWTLGAGWTSSREPDFSSDALSATASKELFERMSTASATVSGRREVVGSAHDPDLQEPGWGGRLDLRWDQILGRSTRGALLATGDLRRCGEELGCLASPYRYVALEQDGDTVALPERNPDRLAQLAGGGQLVQALGGVTAVHAGWRSYLDSWMLSSHSAELALARSALGDRLLVRAEGKLSRSTASSFYRASYQLDSLSEVPTYRTSDRELAGVSSESLTARIKHTSWNVGATDELALSARVQRGWFRYDEDAPLPTRDAWLVGGGVDVAW